MADPTAEELAQSLWGWAEHAVESPEGRSLESDLRTAATMLRVQHQAIIMLRGKRNALAADAGRRLAAAVRLVNLRRAGAPESLWRGEWIELFGDAVMNSETLGAMALALEEDDRRLVDQAQDDRMRRRGG